MKKFIDILKDIDKESAKITNKAEQARADAFELLQQARHNQSGGKLADAETFKTSAEYINYKKAIEEEIQENEKNTIQKIKIELLKANAKAALFAEKMPKVCEVWNKYAGKKYGEKTREKIREEMRTVAGCFVFFSAKYGGEFQISFGSDYAIYYKMKPYEITTGRNGNAAPLVDDDNVIHQTSADEFRIFFEKCEYIEDINDHAKRIIKAYKAAKKAEAEFKKAADAYNELTRGKIERVNPRDGVKNYII